MRLKRRRKVKSSPTKKQPLPNHVWVLLWKHSSQDWIYDPKKHKTLLRALNLMPPVQLLELQQRLGRGYEAKHFVKKTTRQLSGIVRNSDLPKAVLGAHIELMIRRRGVHQGKRRRGLSVKGGH